MHHTIENLKNSETMKKKVVTLATSALLMQFVYAQENQTIIAKGEEIVPAHTIGIGAFLLGTENGMAQGINMRVNKIQTKKFALGISADIGRIYRKGWNGGNETGNVVRSDLKGIYTGVFATASYYFLGSTISKAGLYGRVGLGGVWYKTELSEHFIGYSSTYTYKSNDLSLSVPLCLGSDIKLKKGKLFAEIDLMAAIIGEYSYEGTSSVPSEPGYPLSRVENYNLSSGGLRSIGIHVGYNINF